MELSLGIPNPAGTVPDAIMPTLPDANSQIPAFPYDPIGMETPTWTDEANQYYVDSGNAGCDDSANGGRGDSTTPRCTIPGISGTSWTLAAGNQVFLLGDGATYGGDSDLNSVTMNGSATAPVWIIGLGTTPPELRFERFSWNEGQHVIFDSVHFRSPNDNFRMRWDANGPSEYFTFRHVKCSGSHGTHSEPSRRCFSVGGTSANPVRFVVFYDIEAWGLGRWQDDRDTSRDMLGIQIQKWTRYVWLLNSRIYHMQGDSIMCGNSNWWDYDYASRPHYIYIGGNEFYENYENGYDQKGCYHVVFSQNYVHDFYNSVKGANNTAIITEQDSEGDIGGRYCWFINNTVERTGNPFAAKATTNDAYIYILGNIVREIDNTALLFTQRCYSGGSAGTTCPLGLTFAHNTVDCGQSAVAISNPQNPVGSNQSVEIDGNVFFNCVDGGNGSPHAWESFSDDPLYLQHIQNAHYRTAGGDISLQTQRYDVLVNNVFNQDLLLDSPSGGDYSLAPSSPAKGLVTVQNPAYDLFESMYGINIRQDINGNSWAPTSAINAGAVQ
jgi:hypothetical protein